MGDVIPFPQRAGTEAYLATRQVADHFNVSERLVVMWRAEGRPSYKFGRARRFKVSEVERWLSSRG